MSNLRSICIDEALERLSLYTPIVTLEMDTLHKEIIDLYNDAILSLNTEKLQRKIDSFFGPLKDNFEEALYLKNRIREFFNAEVNLEGLDSLAQEVLFDCPRRPNVEIINALGEENSPLATELALHRMKDLRMIQTEDLDPDLTDVKVRRILVYFTELKSLDLSGQNKVTSGAFVPHDTLMTVRLNPAIHPSQFPRRLFPNMDQRYVFSWDKDKEFFNSLSLMEMVEIWKTSSSLEPFDLKLLEPTLEFIIKNPTLENYNALQILVRLKNKSGCDLTFSNAFDNKILQAYATLVRFNELTEVILNKLKEIFISRVRGIYNLKLEDIGPITFFLQGNHSPVVQTKVLPLALMAALEAKLCNDGNKKLLDIFKQIPHNLIPPSIFNRPGFEKHTYPFWVDIDISLDSPLGIVDLLKNAIALKRACIPDLAYSYLATFEKKANDAIRSATTLEEVKTLYNTFEAKLPPYTANTLTYEEKCEFYNNVNAMGKMVLTKLIGLEPNKFDVEMILRDLEPFSAQLFILRFGEEITYLNPSYLVKERLNCLNASVEDKTIQTALKVCKNLKKIFLNKNTLKALEGGHPTVETIIICNSPSISQSSIRKILFPNLKKIIVSND